MGHQIVDCPVFRALSNSKVKTKGRLFDPTIDKEADSVPIVINEIAARQLGFASPEQALGQALLFRSIENDVPVFITKRIVGIAPEIRFNPLRETPGAVAYELSRGRDVTLTVRASGSITDAERAAQEVWSQYYPNSVLEIRPAKEIYAANYADDARLARLLGFSTAIAMVIAAFGVYVLAADAVQRRTKEIALRKLFGTRRRDIGKLVAKEIGAVVLLSAVVALPLAALAIGRYLALTRNGRRLLSGPLRLRSWSPWPRRHSRPLDRPGLR